MRPHPRSPRVARHLRQLGGQRLLRLLEPDAVHRRQREQEAVGARRRGRPTTLPLSISRISRFASSTGCRPLRDVLAKSPSTRPSSRRSNSRRIGTAVAVFPLVGRGRGDSNASPRHPRGGNTGDVVRGNGIEHSAGPAARQPEGVLDARQALALVSSRSSRPRPEPPPWRSIPWLRPRALANMVFLQTRTVPRPSASAGSLVSGRGCGTACRLVGAVS